MAKRGPHNQNRYAHGPLVSREKCYFLKVFLILWKKRDGKLYLFFIVNMICMMCVFIWIFTELPFYLIDDSYAGQKYGIEFSCQFRCRNMSCETTMRRNLKIVPICSHSHISHSQWWDCESGVVTDFFSYLNHIIQSSRKLFLTKLRRVRVWNWINFIYICQRLI